MKAVVPPQDQRRAAPSGPAIPSGDRPAYPTGEGLKSPCVNVCQMDAATGWCRGCARSMHEIAGWGGAPETFQRHVLDQLPERRVEMHRHGLWLGPWPPSEEQDR